MPALRILGTTARVTVRTVHGLAIGLVAITRFAGRAALRVRKTGAGGEVGMARLLDLHAASCAGDTLVTIGLAGTIFFAVPVGEARSRVALYLLVTMLPFALLAPIVGPVLDRFRHGRRYALATTMFGRAILAYLISEHLGGVALYPAAFGVLVLSRTYGVARSAAVPRLLPPGVGLSEAGARASVFGTAAGAAVAPIGLLASSLGPQWPLRISTVVFFFGLVTALRLPPKADSDPPETVPRLFRRGGDQGKILSGRVVVGALIGSASLRTLYGFLTLYLAFAIRSGDLATDLLGRKLGQGPALALIAGSLGMGSFVATALGTKLRIRGPARLQAAWLVLVTIAVTAVLIRPTLAVIAGLCLTTAVASGLAKLAVDATIQERVGERVRASAFAHSETLLMTAWVAGAAVGLIPFPGRWGVLVAALICVVATARAVAAAVLLRGERLTGTPTSAPPEPEPSAPSRRPAGDAQSHRPGRPPTGGAPADPTGGVDPPRDPGNAPPGFHLYRPSGLVDGDDRKGS
jgi:MFS family permease